MNINQQSKIENRKSIDPDMPITELLELYPEIAPVLTYQYGLYCVNCIIADFDTLKSGAELHGITGEYYTEMLQDLENLINEED